MEKIRMVDRPQLVQILVTKILVIKILLSDHKNMSLISICQVLTENRRDDNNKVEYVPRLLEIVMTQSNQLHYALKRKYANEDLVYPIQGSIQLFRLVEMFNSHRHHIQQNDDHDYNVKLLACRDLKEEKLDLDLV